MTPDTLVIETRALFLARRNVDYVIAESPLREALPVLCRSSNAAVATEAGRIFAVLERRRMGCGDVA